VAEEFRARGYANAKVLLGGVDGWNESVRQQQSAEKR
jgi:rhodanese-related sulfurtransferase